MPWPGRVRPPFLFSLVWASDDSESLRHEACIIALVFLGVSGCFIWFDFLQTLILLPPSLTYKGTPWPTHPVSHFKAFV